MHTSEESAAMRDVRRSVKRRYVVARAAQVIDALFFVVYSLLAVRFVLVFLLARETNAFVRLVYRLSEPLFAPFREIVRSPVLDGGWIFSIPILLAIAAYMLLHAAINGLLRLMTNRQVEI